MTARRGPAESPSLRLRPHHILDIVRNIGNGRKPEPHPYGHRVHEVTRDILEDVDRDCILVVGNDDVCGPCIHLHDGVCDDILPQLEGRVSKQGYNDGLDRRILDYLGIAPGAMMPISAYLGIVKANLEGIVDICTHPKEDREARRSGLVKGFSMLGIEGRERSLPMQVGIRKAGHSDLASLICMMEAFYAESDYVVDKARAEASFLFLMEHPQFGDVLLAERGDAACGYLITKYYYSMGVYGFVCSIEDLFVRKEERRKGAAGRLIESGLGLARDKGMRVFSVEVGRGNEAALALYRKYGFRNRNEDILTMECEDV